jgi:hypothetical protein
MHRQYKYIGVWESCRATAMIHNSLLECARLNEAGHKKISTICLNDDGEAIPKRQLKRIFQAFFTRSCQNSYLVRLHEPNKPPYSPPHHVNINSRSIKVGIGVVGFIHRFLSDCPVHIFAENKAVWLHSPPALNYPFPLSRFPIF